ncbi:hypothetical protein [Parasphingorhabdus sp.]|uniref:tetratricopeptide repeat protein n=1 Tax=Parasphingorhabdus sp. TaxID=2709688 RepID=UPI003267AF3B
MSKLLHFLVDHKLLDDGQPLTAYAVAVDALGRDDGFNTQIDSYPRVQIGRLRRMLDHFYLRENSEHRLSIPYQHYEIILGPNELGDSADDRSGEPTEPEDDVSDEIDEADLEEEGAAKPPWFAGRGFVFAILGGVIALAVATVFYLQRPKAMVATSIEYPAIIVKGPEAIADPSSRAKIEMALSYLGGTLEKFDQVRVFDESADPTQFSHYLLESSSLNEAADNIQLRLIDSASREVLWSNRISMATTEEREAELDKAVLAIASPYGKIAQHELSKYRDDFTAGYPCLLQFHQYLRYRDTALLKPTLKCMGESARQFPNEAYLLSMIAVAQNISERLGYARLIDGKGKDFAQRAAQLDHNSATATFAVAQSAFFESDCSKGVAWGKRAVSYNPLNSRIMGHLGTYMLACDMPEGEEYSARALEMDPNADLAVAATLAIQKLRRGEAKEAQELASAYLDSAPSATPGLELSYILATAMLGEKDEARRSWLRLVRRSDLPEDAQPREVLSRWFANPDLVDELVSDFEKSQLFD